ncbi:DUF4942 domain-containing protein [Parasphingorhabdus sp.]|uniref:DUF4942 domain-containing protein n=1 Tax=Parasphingorhabdus sp. TaxID=2709688 RepID=UPI003A938048
MNAHTKIASVPAIGTPYYTVMGSAAYVVAVEPRNNPLHSICDMAAGKDSALNFDVTLCTKDGVIIQGQERGREYDKAREYQIDPISETEAASLYAEALEKKAQAAINRQNMNDAAEARAIDLQAQIDAIRPSWAKCPIVGILEIDDCDSMTDYFNTKTAKTVLIGWSKHERDLFPEMRKAAATYAETAELATAPDSAEHREKYSMGSGYYLKAQNCYSTGWKVQKKGYYGLDQLGRHIDEISPALLNDQKDEPEIEPGDNMAAGRFTIEEHTHTKRGYQMFIAIIAERVEREEYLHLLGQAKALGGWYTRKFGKCPAGFAFKDKAAALEFTGLDDSPAPDDTPPPPSEAIDTPSEAISQPGEASEPPSEANAAEEPARDLIDKIIQDRIDLVLNETREEPEAVESDVMEEAGPDPLTGSAIRLPMTIADLVAEYDEKAAQVEQVAAAYNESHRALETACTVQGTYAERVGDHSKPHLSSLQSNLLKSAWKATYNRLQIAEIASAKDKKLFDQTMADPPPFTLDNAKATFGDYFIRPRFHILRGLAEAFTALDDCYKSHSNVRLGVKGLPKRVILSGFDGYHSWSLDRFTDIVNALAIYQGKPQISWDEIRAMRDDHSSGRDAIFDGHISSIAPRYGETEAIKMLDRGLTVRKFQNGNAHVFFDKWALLDINKALAEFYGEVLPDAEEKGAKPQASTAVAKDLQFYWSPPEVVAAACHRAEIFDKSNIGFGKTPPPYRVLEPSCGDGRIMDELRARGCSVFGIEFDAKRASQARAKGHAVLTANFLDCEPTGDFDKVVMNPPFYGRHYVKHVNHALKFLKPGGILVAILPATAHYDHKELDGAWQDLPVASFAEAGTNVPTGLLRMIKG